MLDGMRKAAKAGIGRFVMTIVLGLIIFSFVIWGIGDMFRGFVADKVANVGSAVITAREFQNEFQNLIYQYQRRYRVAITTQQARAQGIDMQVLGQLINDAALDQRAHALGLALSDAAIAEAARSDPQLQDANGQFSRALFDQSLRDSGLSEAGFFAKQRAIYLRQQMLYSLVDGLSAPKPLVAALVGAEAQARDIVYFTLAPSAANDISAPSDEALKSYFEARKSSYRAPEYRAIDILLVTPATLAKPDAVSDDDARAVYDKTRDRFGQPEKRAVQQIMFASEAEAAEALGRIKAGATFDDIAKARNLTGADLELGEVSKADFFDSSLAEAAFALPQGAVSDVVKGKFGFPLLRVTKIVPASLKPFDEVKDEVKQQIATERAAADVQTIHDKIEDQRVAGKLLSEAAKSVGLPTRSIEAIDARGQDPKGAAVDLPESRALLAAVFASDVGVDDAALNTHDRGFLWFDVAKVEPAHDRTFEEVKDQIEKQWREEQVSKALSVKAADLVKQIDAGAIVADLATSLAVETKTATGLKRNERGALPENVVAAVFAGSADKAGSVATPEGRLIFKVTKDETPPFDASAPGVNTVIDKLGEGLQQGLAQQYILALRKQLGVTINQRTLQMAEGG